MIITISSALFGILLALVDKGLLVKAPSEWFVALIVRNSLTIMCALISYSTANKAIDKKVQIVLHKSNEKNHWECATKYLNIGCLVATCVMIIFLAIIMWVIFSKGEKL